MKTKSNMLLVCLTIFALVVVACGQAGTEAPTPQPTTGPAPEAGEPYILGAFFSTTGPTSSLGEPEANTVLMLAEQVNTAGGVTGPDGKLHQIVVKLYDDQSDATKAVEVVKKLIEEDKAAVIIGGSGSPASIAVIETVTTAGVPFISVASSSKIVNAADGAQNKWVFKTPQQNLPVALVQLDWLKANDITKVASLGVNNAFGADSMGALKATSTEAGIELVAEETFEPGTTDFSAQLTKIAGTDAEALIVHATPGEGAPLTVQFRDLGLEIPIIHNHGIGNKAFIDAAGEASNGVLFPIGKLLVADQLPDSDPQKATLLQYQADYSAKYGKPPSTFGGHAWDAFQMVKGAFEAVGADSAAIRDHLETEIHGWIGISGTFNITSQDHTGIGKESLVLVEIKDGGWVYCAPADYASMH